MNFIEHFNFLGVDVKQIPTIVGTGAPTTETKGAVGCFYIDANTGTMYKCIKVEGGVYIWEKEITDVYTTEEVNDLCDQVRQQMREETSWHTNDKSNPHNVTAEQLGAEVTTNKSTVIDNTADDTKYPTTKAVKDYVDTGFEINTITETAEGSSVNITDSANAKLKGLRIFGKTTQADVPSIENPQELVSVGNSGSITTKICGANLFNPSSVSAGNLYTVNDAPVLSNAQGTTITSTTYDGKVIVTQTVFANSSNPRSYENGYFMFGLYNNILKFGKEYTFIADIKITNNLGETGLLYLVLPYGTVAGIFKNNKIYFNFQFLPNSNAPQQRFLDIRCNGMSFELSNIMIVEGNAVDKEVEYEPFKGQTLTLNTPNGLPGVPVASGGNYTDENGQQYVCDEIDGARSKYVQKVATVTYDGSSDENHVLDSSGYFKILIPTRAISKTEILCNKMIEQRMLYATELGFFTNANSRYLIFTGVYNQGIATTTGGLREWLSINPLTFMYILEEPIERDLTEEEIAQYKALTTHKPVTNVFNDAGAYMSVDYVADPKTYIDNKFAELQAAILNVAN